MSAMFSACCDEYINWEYGDFEGDSRFNCDGCGNELEVDESTYWSEYFEGMTDEELEAHEEGNPYQLCELCEYDRSEGLWYSPCPH